MEPIRSKNDINRIFLNGDIIFEPNGQGETHKRLYHEYLIGPRLRVNDKVSVQLVGCQVQLNEDGTLAWFECSVYAVGGENFRNDGFLPLGLFSVDGETGRWQFKELYIDDSYGVGCQKFITDALKKKKMGDIKFVTRVMADKVIKRHVNRIMVDKPVNRPVNKMADETRHMRTRGNMVRLTESELHMVIESAVRELLHRLYL